MEKITVIGGVFDGEWELSTTDLARGFIFLESIPLSEIADIKKKEAVKRVIFAEVKLLNGDNLTVKMHDGLYERLYTGYLKNRPQGQKLALPQTRVSVAHILVGLVGILFLASILLGNGSSSSPTQAPVASPAPAKVSVADVTTRYRNPYKYIGTPVSRASKRFGVRVNEGGNLVVDTSTHHVLFEVEDGLISYVDIGFKETAPCSQTAGFDSEPLLRALGIYPSTVKLVKKQAHYHTYYDHVNRLKIGVACHYDGANLTVGFSSKYYLQ